MTSASSLDRDHVDMGENSSPFVQLAASRSIRPFQLSNLEVLTFYAETITASDINFTPLCCRPPKSAPKITVPERLWGPYQPHTCEKKRNKLEFTTCNWILNCIILEEAEKLVSLRLYNISRGEWGLLVLFQFFFVESSEHKWIFNSSALLRAFVYLFGRI